jgi:hypothetical protein
MVVETYLDYLLWGGGFPLELLWDLRECCWRYHATSKKTSQTSCKRYTKAINFQKDIADLLQEIHQCNQLPKSRER